MENFIEIGKIINTRGLDGTMKVLSGSDNTSNFINLKYVYIKNEQFEVVKISKVKNFIYLKTKELDKLEKAEKFKNEFVFVNRENIKLENGEYFVCDILNMKVFNSEKEYLGIVTDIDNYGSSDIYTLKNDKKEYTFCLKDGLFESVDLVNNILILNTKILKEVLI